MGRQTCTYTPTLPHAPSFSFSLPLHLSLLCSLPYSLSLFRSRPFCFSYIHTRSLSLKDAHRQHDFASEIILHIDASPNNQLKESAQQERTRLAVAGEGPAQNRFHRPLSVLHAPALLSCIRMLRHLPSALPAPLPLHSMTMLQSMHQKLEGM